MSQILKDYLLSSDKELQRSKSDKEIDINSPNWVEIVRKDALKYQQQISVVMKPVRLKILANLSNAKDICTGVYYLKNIIDTTVVLKKHLKYPLSDVKNVKENGLEGMFKNALLLFIITNMEPDPRDEMIYFKDLIEIAKSRRIDYKRIVQQSLECACDDVKEGVNISTRQFLESFLF